MQLRFYPQTHDHICAVSVKFAGFERGVKKFSASENLGVLASTKVILRPDSDTLEDVESFYVILFLLNIYSLRPIHPTFLK